MKIGIDIGGSHIAVGVVDKEEKIVEKTEKSFTSKEKQHMIQAIEEQIVECVSLFSSKYKITQIGISMPGFSEDGVIYSSGNVGIKNYDMGKSLQEKINIPITIRNDAKCAALAEHTYGCLKESDRSLFLTLGTGIGGAVFLKNELLTGGKRPGYEFGHMVMVKDGIPCKCGRKGCFEQYASMKAFKTNLRKALGVDETTRGQELLEILRKNSPENKNYEVIEQVVEEYVENLTIGMANLINIFEPEKIGIGGSFVYFEEVLLPRLKEKIEQENAKRVGRGNIKIETALLGNDAGMIGSVLSACRK